MRSIDKDIHRKIYGRGGKGTSTYSIPFNLEALAKMLGIASAGTLIEIEICCSLDGLTKVRTERMITDHEAKDAAYSIETFILAKNNCQQSRQSGGLIPPGQAYIV